MGMKVKMMRNVMVICWKCLEMTLESSSFDSCSQGPSEEPSVEEEEGRDKSQACSVSVLGGKV